MEKNIEQGLYLTLEEDALTDTRNSAKGEALSTYGSEDESNKHTLLYADELSWRVDEMYFDKSDSSIYLNGEFFFKGRKLGYISPTIKLSDETVLEIIDFYMKKLGKLKTVMEAIKD